MDSVECVVAGAGVVGLAIARALARGGRQVLVLEADAVLGAGTSGRGSGVIHAGLYYPEGSLKARLCVAGRDQLYAFAEAHGLPCERRGKLVVATSAAENGRLDEIAARARGNGVLDLRRLDGAEACALEPALRCTGALLSPSTGVVDVGRLLVALRVEAEEFGAVAAFRAPLERVAMRAGGFTLGIGGAAPMTIGCRILVNAAGHGACALARAIEGFDEPDAPSPYLAKGSYFRLIGASPFSRLIYPVPVPGGVGIHLTIDTAGVARFGPDVEWVDAYDLSVDPGRAALFAADVGRWWPEVTQTILQPDYAGVRPKISGPGEPDRDFVIADERDHGVHGLINLFGIESPGVTAALAIGDHVAALLAS